MSDETPPDQGQPQEGATPESGEAGNAAAPEGATATPSEESAAASDATDGAASSDSGAASAEGNDAEADPAPDSGPGPTAEVAPEQPAPPAAAEPAAAPEAPVEMKAAEEPVAPVPAAPAAPAPASEEAKPAGRTDNAEPGGPKVEQYQVDGFPERLAGSGTGAKKVSIVRNLIESHKPTTRQELLDLMKGHPGISEGTVTKAKTMLGL